MGYVITGIKSAAEVKVGDTITPCRTPCSGGDRRLRGGEAKVFAGMYPVQADKFEELRSVLEKFQLNDASFRL